MSSRSHSRKDPYAQKINLNNNYRRNKRRPSKLCSNCNETKDCIKLFSNKINRIEEIINNYKNFPKKNTKQSSIFITNFTLNNIPCKSEYDLSNFTLENLQKLVILVTHHCNNDNNNTSYKSKF
jgi:hypothetical protein